MLFGSATSPGGMGFPLRLGLGRLNRVLKGGRDRGRSVAEAGNPILDYLYGLLDGVDSLTLGRHDVCACLMRHRA